jgi:D-sedoheptulose 7-phosphate isomerase|tara:strand:- start:4422 stop:5018 length:597 start_codon:yes stop_codon:yes gene_type:complete
MEIRLKDYIKNEIEGCKSIMEKMLNNQNLLKSIEEASQACTYALQNGNKILLAGNGGSAADAQHIAGELVSRFMFDRPGLPAIALTTDTSILTAIGNDYGYENLFSRQVQAHGKRGDVLICYSTSGKSPNIISAIKKAKSMDMITVGLCGNRGGFMVENCEHILEVPSDSTPKIQEGHLVIGHIICGIIEKEIFGHLE